MDQDLELLQRCLTGENSAWEGLLKVYTRKIYSFCYRFTGRAEEAEDLTQEVFIKVFQTLRSFDAAQGSFSTWLHRVARNHLVDHYRRTKKDRITDSIDDDLGTIEEKPSPGSGPAAHVEDRERKELIQRALDRLSPDLREAVVLRDLHDLDYLEISQVLGVPQGTVKSRINRGRLELARVLKRMEGLRGPAEAGSEP
ncbi:MAG TPA: RNA polymerase sigma factor [Terriglobia bacterium]|nr:RNA polymerase sigma factor [Terriglobia bacterium]